MMGDPMQIRGGYKCLEKIINFVPFIFMRLLVAITLFLLPVFRLAAQVARPELFGVSSFLNGSIFSLDLDGNNLKTQKVFSPNGAGPIAALTSGPGGTFAGLLSKGGDYNVGTIFRLNADGSGFTKLHDFSGPDGAQPQSGLICDSQGNYYGTTAFGGQFNQGVIFKLGADNSYQVLHEFGGSGGRTPEGPLLIGSDGFLYGMTLFDAIGFKGTIFKIATDGSGYGEIHTFIQSEGTHPYGGLKEGADGILYGMTFDGGASNMGTVFKISKAGTGFTKIFDFNGVNGSGPHGDVSFGQDGMLYGMTTEGGTLGKGVIFKVNTDGSGFQKIHDFTASAGGQMPRGGLVQDAGGVLYGTASGGFNADGLVFSINPDGSAFTAIKTFTTNLGDYPVGSLVLKNDQDLFGMLSGSNLTNEGTFFQIHIPTVQYTTLFTLQSPTGRSPRNELVRGVNGRLFGIAIEGGPNNQGSIFSIKDDGTDYQMIYAFQSIERASFGSLLPNGDGRMFGMTGFGGATHAGTIFQINEDGSGFSTLHEFDFSDGGYPNANLIKTTGGELLGMTQSGGQFGYGTIFKIGTNGTGFSKIYDFDGTNGATPKGSLIQGSDGMLYGMTYQGGTGNKGVIFKISTGGSAFAKLMDFNGTNGAYPQGNLMEESTTHSLFGMAEQTVFRINKDGTGYSKLLTTNGSMTGTLIEVPNGYLYGIYPFGGPEGVGTIFKMKPDGSGYADVHQLSATNGLPMSSLFLSGVKQSITFNAIPSKTISDTPFSLSATASSGLPVSYSSDNLAVATVAGNTVTVVGLGTANITANQAGNTVYRSAPSVQRLLTVTKNTQTITFNSLPGKQIGDGQFALSATSTSGLTVTYTNDNTSVATISGNTVTIVGAGTTTITAHQSGDGNFEAAADVVQTLTVSKVSQVITFGSLPGKTFGDPSFGLSPTSSSNLAVILTSSNPAIASISGQVVTIHAAGTIQITASQGGDQTYAPAPNVDQTLTITKAAQTITFNSLPGKEVGDGQFALSATSSSGLTVPYTNDNTSVATISGNTVTIVGAGTTTITAHQSGDGNYEAAADVVQTLTVSKVSQVITFGSLPTKTFGDPSFSLSPTSSSNLAVSLTSSDPGIASISGQVVTINAAGTVQITASQAGNLMFAPATPVIKMLTIEKANQTITFAAITATFGDAPRTLTATSSGGLPVQFSSSSDKVAIVGTAISFLKAGSVAINAIQAGNANFKSALVTQTFCINPAKPIIQSTLTGGIMVLASSSTTGNQWYKNASPISAATSQNFTVIENGIYTVKVTTDNCASEMSDPFTGVVTGDITGDDSGSIVFYPNPVKTVLYINGTRFNPDQEVRVTIYDLTGRVADEQAGFLLKTGVAVSAYANGLYAIEVIQGSKLARWKFVKE
jgi:uncharacterized repeat protein (TIGR03803 family)